MGKHPKDKLQKAKIHHESPNDSQPMGTINESTPAIVPIKGRIMDGNAGTTPTIHHHQ